MRLRQHTPTEHQPPTVRFVWLVSFVATLSLVAILAVAKSAQALPTPPVTPPVTAAPTATQSPAAEPEPEAFEEEEYEEECGEEEDESECEEADEDGIEAPSECVLSSAEATVSTVGAHDRLRLVIHYTASSPTAVAVAFGLHGSKGSLYLGESKKRFSTHGVFRQTESLSDSQMTRATGARDFTVQLYAVHAPHYCRHFFDRHLTARQTMPSGLMWTDPEALPRSRRPA